MGLAFLAGPFRFQARGGAEEKIRKLENQESLEAIRGCVSPFNFLLFYVRRWPSKTTTAEPLTRGTSATRLREAPGCCVTST